MPHFIRTGYWAKLKKGFNNYLNLDDLITSLIPTLPSNTLSANDVAAIENADNPSAANVFATMNDIAPLYLKYSAFLSQTSTSAPTALPLVNTIGVIALARTSVGIYTILSSGLFTDNKTTPNKINTTYDNAGNKITIEWTKTTTLTLKTYTAADTSVLGDGILDEQEINIKVFI